MNDFTLRPSNTAWAVIAIADFMASGLNAPKLTEHFVAMAVTAPAAAEDWAAENWVWMPSGIGRAIRSRAAMATVQGTMDAMKESHPGDDRAEERLAATVRQLRSIAGAAPTASFRESGTIQADRVSFARSA